MIDIKIQYYKYSDQLLLFIRFTNQITVSALHVQRFLTDSSIKLI